MLVSDRRTSFLGAEFACLAPYTRFPYVLLVPQSVTEEVLEARLEAEGIQIVKPEKACGLRVGDEGYLEVSFESGKVIETQYVIGADGARSSVSRSASSVISYLRSV